MWSYAKPCFAVAAIAALFFLGVGAAQEGPPTSRVVHWEYKVMDVAVSTYPTILLNPKATPADLQQGEKQLKIQSELDTAWPEKIPYESVDEFERRLVELGAEGWELVMKDRNMVVFKRPRP